MAQGAIQYDGTSLTGLHSAAGAAKTLFFVDAAASGSSHGSLQDGGTAPTVASTTTGWVVGTTAATHYSDMAYASQQGTGTFGTTALPSGPPGARNCFRTQNVATEQFVAGNWSIKLAAIATVAQSGTVHGRIRMWRSTSPTGASATELTTATLTLGNWANLTVATAQDGTVTWAAPNFALNGEYLFCEIALEITVASSGATAACVLRVGNVTPSISTITTTVSTPAMPAMFGTTCCFFNPTAGFTAHVGSLYSLPDNTISNLFVNCIDVIYIDDGSGVTGGLFLQVTGSDRAISGASAITAGKWYFVAITVDVAGNVNAYWKPVTATTLTLGLTTTVTPFVPVQITVGTDGSNASVGTDYFPGNIGPFMIWSGVTLSAAQLEAQSLQLVPLQTEGLWDWWPFPTKTSLTGATSRATVLTAVNAAHLATVDGPSLPTNFNAVGFACPF